MNTQAKTLPHVSTSPNLLDLFRDFVAAYKNWRHKRLLAFIDFRELRDDEITDEMRAEAAEVLKIPREEFVDL